MTNLMKQKMINEAVRRMQKLKMNPVLVDAVKAGELWVGSAHTSSEMPFPIAYQYKSGDDACVDKYLKKITDNDGLPFWIDKAYDENFGYVYNILFVTPDTKHWKYELRQLPMPEVNINDAFLGKHTENVYETYGYCVWPENEALIECGTMLFVHAANMAARIG